MPRQRRPRRRRRRIPPAADSRRRAASSPCAATRGGAARAAASDALGGVAKHPSAGHFLVWKRARKTSIRRSFVLDVTLLLRASLPSFLFPSFPFPSFTMAATVRPAPLPTASSDRKSIASFLQHERGLTFSFPPSQKRIHQIARSSMVSTSTSFAGRRSSAAPLRRRIVSVRATEEEKKLDFQPSRRSVRCSLYFFLKRGKTRIGF